MPYALNCGYYFWVFYKKNLNFYLKFKLADKLLAKLKKLIIIFKKIFTIFKSFKNTIKIKMSSLANMCIMIIFD